MELVGLDFYLFLSLYINIPPVGASCRRAGTVRKSVCARSYYVRISPPHRKSAFGLTSPWWGRPKHDIVQKVEEGIIGPRTLQEEMKREESRIIVEKGLFCVRDCTWYGMAVELLYMTWRATCSA